MKTFIPFHHLNNREAIIVDGAHSSGLILSHWKGQNTHASIADDTSAAIVLNALKQPENFPQLGLPLVTATHFDIDGLVGVWSLFEPGLALEHEKVLKAVARIGDFRELDLSRAQDDEALKIVCWSDAVERSDFYPPFGDDHELQACEEKFSWFLPRFADVVKNVEQFREVWENDYIRIKKEYDVVHGKTSAITQHKDIGLTVVRTPQPVSYYALFSASHGSDILLSIYDGNRYELEYKYTTWVDIVSRPTLPRIVLQSLCDKLNAMETAPVNWHADSVTDTGPILRIESGGLTKEERFAHPAERKIYPSTIAPEVFEKEVVTFFREAYKGVKAKYGWKWAEMKALARN